MNYTVAVFKSADHYRFFEVGMDDVVAIIGTDIGDDEGGMEIEQIDIEFADGRIINASNEFLTEKMGNLVFVSTSHILNT